MDNVTLAALVQQSCADQDVAHELNELARRDPQALRPFHRQLLEAGLAWPWSLYRGADEEFAEHLVELIEAEPSGLLMSVLAATGTQTAVLAIRSWAAKTPEGFLDQPWSFWTQAGGWEFGPLGTMRRLSFRDGFALTPGAALDTSPISGGELEQKCQWCGMALWRVLNADLADPAYAELGLPAAGRAGIAACVRCSCYAPILFSYDAAGECSWLDVNVRPEFYGHEGDEWDLPGTGLALGAKLPPDVTCDPWNAGGSVLGGHPDWIQDSEYPSCPTCSQTMTFLGAITGPDLYHEDLMEGCYYLFFDPSCRVSTVVYQQS